MSLNNNKFLPIEESKITFPYLRKFNMAMGILHLVQGILMLGLGFILDFKREFKIKDRGF